MELSLPGAKVRGNESSIIPKTQRTTGLRVSLIPNAYTECCQAAMKTGWRLAWSQHDADRPRTHGQTMDPLFTTTDGLMIVCMWSTAPADPLRVGSRGHSAAASVIRRSHSRLGVVCATTRGSQRRRRAAFYWTSRISAPWNLRTTYSW